MDARVVPASRRSAPARLRVALAAAALAAAVPAAGCDISWRGESDDGKVRIEGSATTSLVLEAARRPGGLLPPVRRGRPVVLRFSGPVDAASAREAIRVVDETRGDAPVPVAVEVHGAEVRLRPAAGDGARAGARLRVVVAGQPSLRALRGAGGGALAEDAVVRADIVPSRDDDHEPPALAGSLPAHGAVAADPAGAVVLRFTEPVEAAGLASGRVPGRAVRLEADGVPVPFRVVPDREHRELALVPEGGLPAGAAVTVRVGAGLRDAAGNPLEPAEVRFTVRDAGGPPPEWILETFEESAREDRRGTTVPWGDPLAPRTLLGIVEPLPLDVVAGPRARPWTAEPRGGRVRVFVPAADLGEERRLVKGLLLPAAPGGARGDLLGVEVRAAPAGGLVGLDDPEGEALPWRVLAEAGDPVAPRPGAQGWSVPFRRAHRHDGASGLLLEIGWTGTSGVAVLRGSEEPGGEPRASRRSADGPATETAAAPDLRLDTLGERPVALSRWIDAGCDAPRWGAPVARPAPVGARLLLQGAPSSPDGTGPDAAAATEWTEDAARLDGLRWIRFRWIFDDAPGAVPGSVDDLAIPFRR